MATVVVKREKNSKKCEFELRERKRERERDQTKKKKKKYFVNSLANLECDKRKIKHKWTIEREEKMREVKKLLNALP